MVDYSTLQPLDERASQLEQTALNKEAAGSTLPDRLRNAVSERFNSSPLVKQRETALQTFLTSPDRARVSVADTVRGGTILSPTQQQAIMSGIRAADTVPLVSLNDLLKSQFGSISDIVGAGTNAYQADVARTQGQAGLARNAYTTALSRLKQQADDEFRQQQFQYQKEQDARELAQALQIAGMKSGGGAGGTDPFVIDAYINQIKTGNASLTQVPAEIRGAVVARMQALGVNPSADKSAREKSGVQGILTRLKDVYQGITRDENGNQVSDAGDLSGGRLMGPLSRLAGFAGFAPRTKTYADLRKGAAGTLKSIIGETGVLTDQDLERIVGLLPGSSSSTDEAKMAWDNIDTLLNSKYANANTQLPQPQVFNEMDAILGY